jgi:hypothetical protein
MRGFFQKLSGGVPAPATPRLTLAAFGKHPGWDDHILGIGVETETLAHIKQAVYVGGIGGQIDAGAWEKLEPERRLGGFDHVLLWLCPGHTVLGQMWSSTDGKGRSKYPMVLCIDGEAIAPGFMLFSLLPGLERLRDACKTTTSASKVLNDCRAAQDQLRAMLASSPAAALAISPSSESRRRFIEKSELGPNRLGLLRVLHDLKSSGAGGSRSSHLRLPCAGESSNSSILLWTAFLRCVVPEPAPLLVIARAGENWLDAIIGEPESEDFFCLQASPRAFPVATEIPYHLGPDSNQRLREIEARFVGTDSLSTLPSSSSPSSPFSL